MTLHPAAVADCGHAANIRTGEAFRRPPKIMQKGFKAFALCHKHKVSSLLDLGENILKGMIFIHCPFVWVFKMKPGTFSLSFATPVSSHPSSH